MPAPASARRLVVLAGHGGLACLLGIAAALLRAPALSPSSLWLDDAWVGLVSRADGFGDVWLMSVTAPGFTAAIWAVFGVVGFSEAAAQALPYALGVAGPPALYLVLVRRRVHPLAALLAAAVLVTSPLHIEYSTRVKQYTADAFAAIALLGLTWWVAERPGAAARWAALAATAVAATVVSAGVAPVVAGAYAGAVLAAVAAGPVARRLGAWSLGGYCLFAAGWWLGVVRAATSPGMRAYWADHHLPVDGQLGGALAAALRDVALGAVALPWPATALLVGAGLAWLLIGRRPAGPRTQTSRKKAEERHRWPGAAVAVAIIASVLVTALLAALRLAPLGGGRTDLMLYPGIAVAAGMSIDALLRLRASTGARDDSAVRRTAAFVGLGVVTGLVVALALGTEAAGPYPPSDVRPLVETLDERLDADDTVAVYSAARWGVALYTELPVRMVPTDAQIIGWQPVFTDGRVYVLGAHRDEPARYEPEVDRLASVAAEGNGRLWLVSSHARDDLEVLDDLLREEGFREVWREEQPGARLLLLEREM